MGVEVHTAGFIENVCVASLAVVDKVIQSQPSEASLSTCPGVVYLEHFC